MEAVDPAYLWCKKEYEEKDLLSTKVGWFTDHSRMDRWMVSVELHRWKGGDGHTCNWQGHTCN